MTARRSRRKRLQLKRRLWTQSLKRRSCLQCHMNASDTQASLLALWTTTASDAMNPLDNWCLARRAAQWNWNIGTRCLPSHERTSSSGICWKISAKYCTSPTFHRASYQCVWFQSSPCIRPVTEHDQQLQYLVIHIHVIMASRWHCLLKACCRILVITLANLNRFSQFFHYLKGD